MTTNAHHERTASVWVRDPLERSDDADQRDEPAQKCDL